MFTCLYVGLLDTDGETENYLASALRKVSSKYGFSSFNLAVFVDHLHRID